MNASPTLIRERFDVIRCGLIALILAFVAALGYFLLASAFPDSMQIPYRWDPPMVDAEAGAILICYLPREICHNSYTANFLMWPIFVLGAILIERALIQAKATKKEILVLRA